MSVNEAFDEHLDLVERSRTLDAAIGAVADAIAAALAGGGVCYALGNGGSAADAQHFVAEMVGHFDGPRAPLAAIALTTDPSVLTSVANDLSFEEVFARQIRALARPADVVVAISTSGRSPNVVAAADAARAIGCRVVALTAGDGSLLAERSDLVVAVPSAHTQRVQEVHGLLLHVLVDEVRRRIEDGR